MTKPLALSLFTLLTAYGCSSNSSESGNSSENNSSSTQSTSSSSSTAATGSHNAGENCMSSGCHDGTSTADQFTVGGTIFRTNGQANTSATVFLYVHNTNTIAAQLETDASGNFYSTEPVDGLSTGNGELVTGVDVEVHGSGGAIATMPGLITRGACSVCHGASNGTIRVN